MYTLACVMLDLTRLLAWTSFLKSMIPVFCPDSTTRSCCASNRSGNSFYVKRTPKSLNFIKHEKYPLCLKGLQVLHPSHVVSKPTCQVSKEQGTDNRAMGSPQDQRWPRRLSPPRQSAYAALSHTSLVYNLAWNPAYLKSSMHCSCSL